MTQIIDFSIQDSDQNSMVSLYPNPAQDDLMIKLKEKSYPLSYSIVGTLGNEALPGTLESSTQTINIKDFPNGNYVLVMRGHDWQVTHKFMVSK